MTTLASELPAEPWRRRLYLPTYQISEAARYAGVSPSTVAAWHKIGARKELTLSPKESRVALSYYELIEVAVVAAFRKLNVPLQRIRDAREYVASNLNAEYPFASYLFKTDGKHLLMDYDQVIGDKGKGKLLGASQGGQLAWEAIIGRLTEFEYESGANGIVVRWRVSGSIVIDPKLAFGAPTISGTPTWVVKGRYQSGESIDDISKDFDLKKLDVRKALKFEGIEKPDLKRPKAWTH